MFSAISIGLKSIVVGASALALSAYTQVASFFHVQIPRHDITVVSNDQPTTASAQSISNVTKNWAGYVSTKGSFTSISGSWVVPEVSGSGETSADATWIGIGGVTSSDLIQTGTEDIVAPSGQVTTTAFYEMLPDSSQNVSTMTVQPGDTMNASITQAGSDQWTITIADTTSGQSYTTTVGYDSTESSAEWIEEDPSDGQTQVPFDTFSSVTFTDGSAAQNGGDVTVSSSGATAVTMINNDDQTLATPSSLNDDGNGFSVTRGSASSGAAIPELNQDPGGWQRHGAIGQGWDTPTGNAYEVTRSGWQDSVVPTTVSYYRRYRF